MIRPYRSKLRPLALRREVHVAARPDGFRGLGLQDFVTEFLASGVLACGVEVVCESRFVDFKPVVEREGGGVVRVWAV